MTDLQTGTPVVYVSCDAHALKRYVDDTWDAQWKMANGIRIWCVDRHTGENIHLGGEFTWGDCKHVVSIFEQLISLGILPQNGIFSPDIRAQYVWVSDGAAWLEERIARLLGESAISILDVYHVLERAAKYADATMKPPHRKIWFNRFRAVVLSISDSSMAQQYEAFSTIDVTLDDSLFTAIQLGTVKSSCKEKTKRKGHRKNNRQDRKMIELTAQADRAARASHGEDFIERLATLIPADHTIIGSAANDAHDNFMQYISKNSHRIDYPAMQARGLQIGSGAMESMHRNGSQVRLKRPGIKCLPETAQAILDWRMLKIVGRWDEFWSQPNIGELIANCWTEDVLDYPVEKAA
jgi:hypothetical protein